MNDSDKAKTLGDFFANVIKTLNISKFNQSDPVSENVSDHSSKAALKYDEVQKTVKGKCKNNSLFSFCQAALEDIKKLEI